MKLSKTILCSVASLATVLQFTSCTPAQQQGAQYGALAGAGLAAVTGKDTSGILKGAVVGAAVGTGVAAAREHQSSTYNSAAASRTSAPATQTTQYPIATKTTTPGIVKSPYSPYKLVDVQGISSGSLVREPGSDNIFMVP